MAQNEDEDIPKDIGKQLVFSKWSVRKEAFEKLKDMLEKKTKDDPMYAEYAGKLSGFILDTMDACSKAAIILASSFSLYHFSTKDAANVTQAIVTKGILSSKQDMRNTALNVLLDYIEGGKAEYVQKALLSALGSNVNNHLISCEDAICSCVTKFGAVKSGLNSEEIVKGLSKLLSHQNQKVRDSCRLAISTCVWAVPSTPLDSIVKNLSDAQKKEFEKSIAEVRSRKPFKPERKTYEEQQAELFGSAEDEKSHEEKDNTESHTNSEKDDDEIDDTMKEMFEVDSFEPSQLNLPSEFSDVPTIKEWKVRNELLKKVLETVSSESVKRYDISDSNIMTVIRVLSKIIQKETNVFCTISALGIVSVISKKLGKKGTQEFTQFSNNFIKSLLPCMVHRFKDSNRNVVNAINDAIDSMFIRIMSLKSLINMTWGEGCDGTFISDMISWRVEKNPKVRGRFLSAMIRAIQSNNKSKRPAILEFPEREGEDRSAEDKKELFYRRSISLNSKIVVSSSQAESGPLMKFFDLLLLETEDPDDENRNMALTIMSLIIVQNKMLAIQEGEDKTIQLIVNTTNPMNNKIYKKYIEGFDKIKKDKIVDYIKEFGARVVQIKQPQQNIKDKSVDNNLPENEKENGKIEADKDIKPSSASLSSKGFSPSSHNNMSPEEDKKQEKTVRSRSVSRLRGVPRSKTATNSKRKSSLDVDNSDDNTTKSPVRTKITDSKTNLINNTESTLKTLEQSKSRVMRSTNMIRSKSRTGAIGRLGSASSERTPMNSNSITFSTGRLNRKQQHSEFQLNIRNMEKPKYNEQDIIDSIEKHLKISKYNNSLDLTSASYIDNSSCVVLKHFVKSFDVIKNSKDKTDYDSYSVIRNLSSEMNIISEFVRTGEFFQDDTETKDHKFDEEQTRKWLHSIQLDVSANEVESQNINVFPSLSINKDLQLRNFVNTISVFKKLFTEISSNETDPELLSSFSKLVCNIIWYVINPFVLVIRENEDNRKTALNILNKGKDKQGSILKSTCLSSNIVFVKLNYALEDIMMLSFLALKTNTFSSDWEKLLIYIYGSCIFEYLLVRIIDNNGTLGNLDMGEQVDSITILLRSLKRSLESNITNSKGGFSYMFTCLTIYKLSEFMKIHGTNPSLSETYNMLLVLLKCFFGNGIFEFINKYFSVDIQIDSSITSAYPKGDRMFQSQIIVLNPIFSENCPNEKYECLPSPYVLYPEVLIQNTSKDCDDDEITNYENLLYQSSQHLITVYPPSLEIIQEMQEATTNMTYGSGTVGKNTFNGGFFSISSNSVANIQTLLTNVNKLVTKKKQRLTGRIIEIFNDFTENGLYSIDLYNTYVSEAFTSITSCNMEIKIDNSFPADQEINIDVPSDSTMKTPSLNKYDNDENKSKIRINISRLYVVLLKNILNWYRGENNTSITSKLLEILTKMVAHVNYSHNPAFGQFSLRSPKYLSEVIDTIRKAVSLCVPRSGISAGMTCHSSSNMILNNMFGVKTGISQTQASSQMNLIDYLLVNNNLTKDVHLIFSPLYSIQSISYLDIENTCQITNIPVYNGVVPEGIVDVDHNDAPLDDSPTAYNSILKMFIDIISSSIPQMCQDKTKKVIPNNGIQQTTLMNVYKFLVEKTKTIVKMLFMQQIKVQLLNTVNFDITSFTPAGEERKKGTYSDLIKPSAINKELMRELLELIKYLFIKYIETYSTQTNNLSAIITPLHVRGLIKALIENVIYIVNYSSIYGYSERVDHVDKIVKRLLENNQREQIQLSVPDKKKLEKFYELIKTDIFNNYKLKIERIIEEFKKQSDDSSPVSLVELESTISQTMEVPAKKSTTTVRKTGVVFQQGGATSGSTNSTQTITVKDIYMINRFKHEMEFNYGIILGTRQSHDAEIAQSPSMSDNVVNNFTPSGENQYNCPKTPSNYIPIQNTEKTRTPTVNKQMVNNKLGEQENDKNGAVSSVKLLPNKTSDVICNINSEDINDIVVDVGTRSVIEKEKAFNDLATKQEDEKQNSNIKIPDYELDELRIPDRIPRNIDFLPSDISEKLVIVDSKTKLSTSFIMTEKNKKIDNSKSGNMILMIQEIKKLCNILSMAKNKLNDSEIMDLVNCIKAILRLDRNKPGLLKDCGFGITIFNDDENDESDVISIMDICLAILSDKSLKTRENADSSSINLGIFGINKGLDIRVLKYCLLLLCTVVDYQFSELDGATTSMILFAILVFKFDWGLNKRVCPNEKSTSNDRKDDKSSLDVIDDITKAAKELGIDIPTNNNDITTDKRKPITNNIMEPHDKLSDKKDEEHQDFIYVDPEKTSKMMNDCSDLIDVLISKILNIKVRDDIIFKPVTDIGCSVTISSLLLLIFLAGKINSILLEIKADELYDFITTQTDIPKNIDVYALFRKGINNERGDDVDNDVEKDYYLQNSSKYKEYDNEDTIHYRDILRTIITPVSVVEYLRTQGMEETAFKCLNPLNYKFVDQLKQYIILGRTADDNAEIKRNDINNLQQLTRLDAILRDKIGLYKILRYIVHLVNLCLETEIFKDRNLKGSKLTKESDVLPEDKSIYPVLNKWCGETYDLSLNNIEKYIERLRNLMDDNLVSGPNYKKILSLERLKTILPCNWPAEIVYKFSRTRGQKNPDYYVIKNIMKVFKVLSEQRKLLNNELMYIENIKRKILSLFKDNRDKYNNMEANINYPLPIINKNRSGEEYNNYCKNGIYNIIREISMRLISNLDKDKFVFLLRMVPTKSIYRETVKKMVQEMKDDKNSNEIVQEKQKKTDKTNEIATYTTLNIDKERIMKYIDLISGNSVGPDTSIEEKKVISDKAIADLTSMLVDETKKKFGISILEESKFEELVNSVISDKIENVRYPEILIKYIRGSVMGKYRHII